MADLDKSYQPQEIEDKLYEFWKKNNFFHANASSKKPSYSIVLPPPNVTGSLHMGHALDDTIQDLLIRYKRMRGFEVLWVPGTDHAGIATQTVVEKHLMATLGKRRKDFTREDFLSKVWAWKEEKEKNILSQLKKMGVSCDWSRLRFTMDNQCSLAVRTVFKKMYEDGLIYRGLYLVNWDPVTQTALADDEVEHEERDSFLWYFRYPIKNENFWITVATTRPETMLGDTAVAVSPKDERFSSLIGKTVVLPIVGREIPIIADAFVSPEFGTGAVKITPAHDFDDYAMGERHKLKLINILTPDGKINENGKEFQGLLALDARKAVVEKMKNLGLLEKIEPYKLRVGVSYRSKAIIEPFLSKQWFVKMTAFKELLRKTVEDKKVLLIPSQWEQVYYYWIDHLRDWCISRQLWWGHQIPIWYNKKDPKKMICFDGEGLPEEVKKHPEDWKQDEDVLDTWFSSALWPFSVMGWPNQTEDLKKFYPTSTLVTGHDILFFWVARMILMAEYCTKNIPFEKVFIHGLIYGKSYWTEAKDGSVTYIQGKEKEKYDLGAPLPPHVAFRWEKMSKSKGNIIDPLELIDSYGTDAVRMTLAASATGARQIDLDRRRFEEYKNFANKLWNATRFVLQNLEENKEKNLPVLTKEKFSTGMDLSLFTLEDFWILSKVNKAIVEMNQSIEDFCFDKATNCFYHFFWNEFCSCYLELVKPNLFGNVGSLALRENKQKLLVILLGDIVRMLHPIMPFITEEIFSYLKALFGGVDVSTLSTKDLYTVKTLNAFNQPACIVAPFPQLLDGKDIRLDVEEEFSFFEKLIYAIRNIRAEMQIPLGVRTDVHFIGSKQELARIEKNQHILQALVKVKGLIFSEKKPKIFGSMALVEHVEIYIPLPEEFIAKEKERLAKEKEKLLKLLASTEERLKTSDFVERAPKELVEKTKDLLEKTKAQIAEIEKKLKTL